MAGAMFSVPPVGKLFSTLVEGACSSVAAVLILGGASLQVSVSEADGATAAFEVATLRVVLPNGGSLSPDIAEEPAAIGSLFSSAFFFARSKDSSFSAGDAEARVGYSSDKLFVDDLSRGVSVAGTMGVPSVKSTRGVVGARRGKDWLADGPFTGSSPELNSSSSSMTSMGQHESLYEL